MARELHTCLVRYFARLERLDDKWRELSRKAERPLECLANRTEQLRHVMNEEIEGAEESVDQETRERLIFKIFMGLEEEIALLSDILTQFNDANQDLKNYLVNLENARSKVSLKDEAMQELIKGTPYQPTLELLLEWAVESFQFFHNMYLRISDCMRLIDYKTEETVHNLISSFMEEKRGRKNINTAFALAVPRLYASFVNILVQYLINKNEVMLTAVNAKANAAYISGILAFTQFLAKESLS